MKPSTSLYCGLSLVFCLGMASCATVGQKITLAPLDTPFPVSASQSLLVKDQVMTESDWKAQEPFTVSRTLKKPVGVKEFSLDLEDTLKSQLASTSFNGVTQLKIEVKDINNATATWVAFERNLAFWTSGVALAYVSYSASLPARNGGGNYLPAVGMLGVSAGLWGGSFLHESLGTIDYKIDVSGVKVAY